MMSSNRREEEQRLETNGNNHYVPEELREVLARRYEIYEKVLESEDRDKQRAIDIAFALYEGAGE